MLDHFPRIKENIGIFKYVIQAYINLYQSKVTLRILIIIFEEVRILFFFVFLPFLGPLLRHLEVPRLGG